MRKPAYTPAIGPAAHTDPSWSVFLCAELLRKAKRQESNVDLDQLIAREQAILIQSYKRPPLVLERGEGAYLYDSEGQRYLDFMAGIGVNALGYGDPGLADAVRRHADALFHVSNLFLTRPQVLLAERLVNSCFADRVFFTNSGTEAVEGALKFARKVAYERRHDTIQHEVIAFTHAFHGRSMGALAATANEKYRRPYEPLISGVHFAPYNDIEAARALISEHTAAVILEPIQGEGGIMPASESFLRGLRQACDEVEALLIFDEVQCGMGRTGILWAHQWADVQPDIMVTAKPLGGGLPIGAILSTEAVASAIRVGDHGSTFAGGPFITTVAQYVFDRVNAPVFLDHVKDIGNYLGEALSGLVAEGLPIHEVRGRGLMWGVELQAEYPAYEVVAAAVSEGLLLVGAGRNTVRILPPLIIGASEVDDFCRRFRATLRAFAPQRAMAAH